MDSWLSTNVDVDEHNIYIFLNILFAFLHQNIDTAFVQGKKKTSGIGIYLS